MVEKEAADRKTKAAVARVMYPAYWTTGRQKRTLAISQQQKADLEGGGRLRFSLAEALRATPV